MYVFSDGLVGCDTTSKPKRFFTAMIDPKNIVGFDFDDEGFDVEIRPSSVGAGSTANKVSLNMRTDTAIPVMQQSSGEYSAPE